MKKDILIDFDGTINNTLKRHYILHNLLCKKYKLEKISYVKFIYNKKKKIKNINLFKSNKIKKKLYIKSWIETIEKKKFLKIDNLFKGVKEKLKFLSLENNLYLNTFRNNKVNFYEQLNRYKLKKFFKKIYFISNKKFKNKKLFFKNINFKDLIIIGDNNQDFQIKKKAIKIGVLSGFTSKTLLKKKTNYVFKKFIDIKVV